MNELTSVFDTTGNFWIGNVPWQKAIHDILAGKAFVVAEHDANILTVRPEFHIKKPKWVVKLHANTARKLVRGHPPTLRNVFEEYDGICAYCTRETFIPTKKTVKRLVRNGTVATRDHIWPKCRGGGLEWKNTALACGRCNSKKGGRSPEEAGMKLLVNPRVPRLTNGIITVTEAESRGLLV